MQRKRVIKIIKIDKDFVYPLLPKRYKNSHKGSYGTAALVCGSNKMPGAAILSNRAAYRTGVGMVKSIIPKSIYPIVAVAVPEAVFEPYEKFDISLIKNSSACLIGCGCGNNNATKASVETVIKEFKGPIVVDADGINTIAENIHIIKQFSANAVITPHPKEASGILGVSVPDIQKNREKYAKMLCEKSGAVSLLKGANTLISVPNGNMYILENDNPGLATAGSGDVLSGIIVSLLAQGLSAEHSAVAGAFIHAKAGVLASERLSQTSMYAGDIIDSIAELFCNIEQNR